MTEIRFTDRQTRIGKCVAVGFTNREIALELGIKEQIVKNEVHTLFDRLGVWNRVELANYFSQSTSPEVKARTTERIEEERVAELRRQNILDTSSERFFDELAVLTASIFDVPIALIALVDSGRVWFKAGVGLAVPEVSREITICNHTIRQSHVFVVNDASKDPRFKCSPLVSAEPRVRFYAAAPIITEDGYALGVVCIVDRKPRQMTDTEVATLGSLARIALEQINLRRQLIATDVQQGRPVNSKKVRGRERQVASR